MKNVYRHYLLPLLAFTALLLLSFLAVSLEECTRGVRDSLVLSSTIGWCWVLYARFRYARPYGLKLLRKLRRNYPAEDAASSGIFHMPTRRFSTAAFAVCLLLSAARLGAQTETIAANSFIVNMGITPQDDAKGLKPYGMIYDLLRNYQVPIKWVINSSKGRDGVDFVHNGVTYRGGAFIIPAEYRTSTVNGRITFWQGQGVQGNSSVSAITVPVYATLKSAPRWALNPDKADVSSAYILAAGIPSSAYYIKSAVDLGQCDDVFLIPHDDNISATNLATWNQTYKGYIWVGCKSGSVMENNVAKFLSTTGLNGVGGSWGSPSVTYDFNGDPPMQFMGNTAHQQNQANGANRSYTPISTWRATTKKLIYITGQQQAAMVYGPAFGNTNNGYVMISGGHDYNDNVTSVPNRVALIRAMLNFSFMSVVNKAVNVAINVPATIPAGTGTTLSYTITPPGGTYSTVWSSSCGGTFSPNTTTATVTYTPPANISSCVISVKVTDSPCGRVAFDSKPIEISCELTVQKTITQPSCNGGTNGSIAMTISGGAAPYSWNWSRVSPTGTGSGTGTSITGLSAGTYNVTVSSPSGCSATYSALVSQPNALVATASPVNPACFGQKGAVNLTVSGGTPAYTYSWTGPAGYTATTQNISALATAGTYNVTVTDSKACTATASAAITIPTAVAIALTSSTNVSCKGGANGAIDITPSGGTSGYTYLWSDGPSTQDRTSLAAGTYVVTVTDANACTATRSVTITEPAILALTTAKTDPTCPPGSTPPLNSDGAIDLTVTGGTSPYTYNWTTMNGSGLVPASQDQTGLIAGTYSVTVTDNKACTASTSVTLTYLNPNPVQPGAINHN